MGAEVDVRSGYVHAKAKTDGLKGGPGLSGHRLRGRHHEHHAGGHAGRRYDHHRKRGQEPHIVDLANFLNSMGADIMGAAPT